MQGTNFTQSIEKMAKLRRIITKAWLPLGISKAEACDCLEWAIGRDVLDLPFRAWTERIQERTGVRCNKVSSVFKVFRQVGLQWKREKPMIFS